MFDPKWIRDHPDLLDRGLERRGLEPEGQRLISIDERRRAIIRVRESWNARRNAASVQIAQAMAKSDQATVEKLKAEVAECKASLSTLEREEKDVEIEWKDALSRIPNVPFDDVPDGKNEKGNVEYSRENIPPKPKLGFEPKLHFEIGEALGLMNFEAAVKLSGARFVVLKGALARLERAIGQLFLDTHTTEHAYEEVSPPLMVNPKSMVGTAQLPKFADDQFYTNSIDGLRRVVAVSLPVLDRIPNRDPFDDRFKAELLKNTELEGRWLIPTAEVPLTNLVRESIVEESALPMRLTACTPCFRAEAGAAGKDTRGMIRQHQFTKVELVSITTPEQSEDEHERMLKSAEAVLKKLNLHYRVMTLCTGDMGFASRKTYDIEVWLPGENTFREISSCSNCGEFQARRMEARYRVKDSKQIRHVHTLNGSGVAVGRALIAVLENYQEADGSVRIPDALQPYMGGLKRIEKAK